LGGTDASEAEMLGRAAGPYEVPLVTPAVLPGLPSSDNTFSINAGQAFRGQVLARFVAQELKVDRVTILADSRQQGALALTEAFTKAFRAAGGAHVDEWSYKADADFADVFERLKKSRPKAVLHAGPVAESMKLHVHLQS